jgi:HSP20 family protein
MARFLAPLGGRGLFARDPFLDFRREMDRLFDDSFGRAAQDQGQGFVLSPKVDVTQTDDGWEVTAELPGVDQDDIDLRLDGDLLTISGEKRDEKKDEKNRFVERRYGSFTRSFTLPFAPDPDKITADCEKGVLTIKLPKGVEQERSKKIPIGGTTGKTIEAKASGEPAMGKQWSTKKVKAEKGQDAPV